MCETKDLAARLRAMAEEMEGDPWPPPAGRLLIEAAEELEHFTGGMVCSFCDGTGCTGRDYFGEAIDCRYCDDGKITPEAVKSLQDRFDELAGEAMSFSVEREELKAEIHRLGQAAWDGLSEAEKDQRIRDAARHAI